MKQKTIVKKFSTGLPGWRKDPSQFVTEAGCLHREEINLKQVEPFKNRAKNVNDVLCMDLVGPLTISLNENKYIFMMLEQFNFCTVVPIPDKLAKTISIVILTHWIALYRTQD